MKILKGYCRGDQMGGYHLLNCSYYKKLSGGKLSYVVEGFAGRVKLFKFAYKNRPLIRNLYLLNILAVIPLILAYIKAAGILLAYILYGGIKQALNEYSLVIWPLVFWEVLALVLLACLII